MPASSARRALLLLALTGCALNVKQQASEVGAAATQAIVTQLRSDSTRQTVRVLVADAVASASDAYGAHFQPRIDTMLGNVTQSGHAFIQTERDSLIDVLRGTGRAAIEDVVGASVRTAGDEGRRQMKLAITDATDALETRTIPMLVRATSDAARAAVDSAFGNMGPRVQLLVDSIVASAVRTGIHEGNRSLTQSPVWQAGLVIAGGAVLALLMLGAAWLWYDRTRTRTALATVTSAVKDTTDPTLKSRIQEHAERQRVERYLHEFLVRQGDA